MKVPPGLEINVNADVSPALLRGWLQVNGELPICHGHPAGGIAALSGYIRSASRAEGIAPAPPFDIGPVSLAQFRLRRGDRFARLAGHGVGGHLQKQGFDGVERGEGVFTRHVAHVAEAEDAAAP